jgi:Tol biopolymer transport system component
MTTTKPKLRTAASILGVTCATVASTMGTATAAGEHGERGNPDQAVTRLVTKSAGVRAANGNSRSPKISGDCTAVAYVSAASNLVKGDTKRFEDVFIRDRGRHQTALVSQGLRGARAGGDSRLGDVSRAGRFVAYDSEAANLVPGDTNGLSDVFVRDLRRARSELISDAIGDDTADGTSLAGSISANGRYVAFSSDASNLVRGDTNTFFDVFVRDRTSGTTERVSVPPGGGETDEASFEPTISANGRYVSFESAATNLVANDTNQFVDVFRYDRKTGALVLVTAGSDGSPLAFGGSMSNLSADGSTAVFWTPDEQVVSGDGNATFDVFVRDIAAATTELGAATDADAFPADGSSDGALSADGGALAFMSSSSDVAAPDTDTGQDVFVRDRDAGTTELISASTRGEPGNGLSFEPDISDDGRCVAFSSTSTNLIGGDSNAFADILLRRLPR